MNTLLRFEPRRTKDVDFRIEWNFIRVNMPNNCMVLLLSTPQYVKMQSIILQFNQYKWLCYRTLKTNIGIVSALNKRLIVPFSTGGRPLEITGVKKSIKGENRKICWVNLLFTNCNCTIKQEKELEPNNNCKAMTKCLGILNQMKGKRQTNWHFDSNTWDHNLHTN